jgi:hypothetical protein
LIYISEALSAALQFHLAARVPAIAGVERVERALDAATALFDQRQLRPQKHRSGTRDQPRAPSHRPPSPSDSPRAKITGSESAMQSCVPKAVHSEQADRLCFGVQFGAD